jgi:hypothetical protein
MSRGTELLDELEGEANARCENCAAPEQRTAIDRMCGGTCVECENKRVPESAIFATEDMRALALMGRELHALYADAVLCEDAGDLVKVLIERAEREGFTKNGRTLTKAGKEAADRFAKAEAS